MVSLKPKNAEGAPQYFALFFEKIEKLGVLFVLPQNWVATVGYLFRIKLLIF
jgi:hypothetical protein